MTTLINWLCYRWLLKQEPAKSNLWIRESMKETHRLYKQFSLLFDFLILIFVTLCLLEKYAI